MFCSVSVEEFPHIATDAALLFVSTCSRVEGRKDGGRERGGASPVTQAKCYL